MWKSTLSFRLAGQIYVSPLGFPFSPVVPQESVANAGVEYATLKNVIEIARDAFPGYRRMHYRAGERAKNRSCGKGDEGLELGRAESPRYRRRKREKGCKRKKEM